MWNQLPVLRRVFNVTMPLPCGLRNHRLSSKWKLCCFPGLKSSIQGSPKVMCTWGRKKLVKFSFQTNVGRWTKFTQLSYTYFFREHIKFENVRRKNSENHCTHNHSGNMGEWTYIHAFIIFFEYILYFAILWYSILHFYRLNNEQQWNICI